MLKDELFLDLYPKYAPKFEKVNLNFQKVFDDVYDKSYADGTNTFKQVIVKSLDSILDTFIKSKPKTEAGRWTRVGAQIFKFFLPFIKFIKLK